jgi:hypothetical protein
MKGRKETQMSEPVEQPDMTNGKGVPVVSAHIAEAVAKHLPDDVDGDQVRVMMEAWMKVLGGDPIDTVKRSPDGVIAHRISVHGVPQWRISNPDGGTMTDVSSTNASLPWEQLWPKT